MNKILSIPLLLVMLTCGLCHAQTKPEVLTNASIINLVKAGLGDDLVIAKIEASPAKFDVSTNSLIALKNQKISNEVIKAMVSKASGAPSTAKLVVSQAGSLPPLDLINQLYSYQKTTNTATPLEKTFAAMKAKTKLLGYGGASVVLTVDEEKSPVRITDTAGTAFLVHASGISPSDFVLYKLTIEKKKRQAMMQKINSGFKGFGSTASEAGATIPFNVTQLKDGIFQLSPSAPLQKGEYIFVAKTQAGGGTVDVYAFGID